MNLLKFAIFFILFIGCATKAPMEHLDTLKSLPNDQVPKLTSIDPKTEAIVVEFNKKTNSILNPDSPVVKLSAEPSSRSYYKTFKMTSKGEEQFIEIRAFPYKPFGFGQLGIIQPLLFVFDDSGKPLTTVGEVFSGYAHSFMDGDYYRGVWRVRGLKAQNDFYVLVAAKAEVTGKQGKSFTNYGGASVGVIMTHGVEFSPVGAFAILQTDSFKK